MTAWSELPLIHDAAFYAVAVPAVLMMGLSKSGFLGGFGSLAVPLMALAILSTLLFLTNKRIWAGIKGKKTA